MSYRNREIESKLVVQGSTLAAVRMCLHGKYALSAQKMVSGHSRDTYWSITNPQVSADFIRMRVLDDHTVQVTVKGKDRSNNLDRIEREFSTDANPSTVRGVLTAAHGKISGSVVKKYYVWWTDEHTTISCYQIEKEDGWYPEIYVEVESTTMEKMLELEKEVLDLFPTATRAAGSLYELFVLKKGA